MTSLLNKAILKVPRRAEGNDLAVLVNTFVSAGSLFDLIVSKDDQILYGRRGTGKTHVLKYLKDERQRAGDISIYVDMRTVGSNNGIYQDISIPIAERGTRLLCDVLEYIYTSVSDYVYETDKYSSDLEFGKASDLLEVFRRGISDVVVQGNLERIETSGSTRASDKSKDIGIQLSSSPGANLGLHKSSGSIDEQNSSLKISGPQTHRVHFGTIGKSLEGIINGFGAHLWLLLDEWSDIPLDLQPLLADLLRKTFMPLQKTTLKIAAIEKRTNFMISNGLGGYIGFELGADIFADMRLDDFMVFGNDVDKSRNFFADLFLGHVNNILSEDGQSPLSSSQEFISNGFTQGDAFDELVRAGEGIPRDALNIAMLAARKAGDSKISIPDIRSAARDWYISDKQKSVQINAEAEELLNWVIDEVIGRRKARGFMLAQGFQSNHDLISHLYDVRIIHLAKSNISAKDQPGVRYDAYVLDYGCYVHLINTAAAPKGMFEVEADSAEAIYVEVPKDDYRSIRRAILDMYLFDKRNLGLFRVVE